MAPWLHAQCDTRGGGLAHFRKTGNDRYVRYGAGYVVDGPGVPLPKPIRLATLRKLAAHGLVDWDGGAFDPEAAAVLSEQGRFVLAKGRPETKARSGVSRAG